MEQEVSRIHNKKSDILSDKRLRGVDKAQSYLSRYQHRTDWGPQIREMQQVQNQSLLLMQREMALREGLPKG